jgi:hypothetical protein
MASNRGGNIGGAASQQHVGGASSTPRGELPGFERSGPLVPGFGGGSTGGGLGTLHAGNGTAKRNAKSWGEIWGSNTYFSDFIPDLIRMRRTRKPPPHLNDDHVANASSTTAVPWAANDSPAASLPSPNWRALYEKEIYEPIDHQRTELQQRFMTHGFVKGGTNQQNDGGASPGDSGGFPSAYTDHLQTQRSRGAPDGIGTSGQGSVALLPGSSHRRNVNVSPLSPRSPHRKQQLSETGRGLTSSQSPRKNNSGPHRPQQQRPAHAASSPRSGRTQPRGNGSTLNFPPL